MMKAADLRLGNWLKVTAIGGYNNIGDLIKVSSINSWSGINEWSDMGASGSNRFEDIYPIPLTPEILDKAGFVKVDEWYEGKQYMCEPLLIQSDVIGSAFSCALSDFDIELKYLHQLQNLYFALTGKELEIKL